MDENAGKPQRDAEMEARVDPMEPFTEKRVDRLTDIERDLSVVKSSYATRADVAEAKASIVLWMVSVVFLAQLLPVLPKRLGIA
ncbi:MAG TPA: hypothetical protein VH328_09390 [Burkholderiaceae bacterium]|nr:hypothetical protein [Burkholderiaceae bacterium]